MLIRIQIEGACFKNFLVFVFRNSRLPFIPHCLQWMFLWVHKISLLFFRIEDYPNTTENLAPSLKKIETEKPDFIHLQFPIIEPSIITGNVPTIHTHAHTLRNHQTGIGKVLSSHAIFPIQFLVGVYCAQSFANKGAFLSINSPSMLGRYIRRLVVATHSFSAGAYKIVAFVL